jgi:hypothetical protein
VAIEEVVGAAVGTAVWWYNEAAVVGRGGGGGLRDMSRWPTDGADRGDEAEDKRGGGGQQWPSSRKTKQVLAEGSCDPSIARRVA